MKGRLTLSTIAVLITLTIGNGVALAQFECGPYYHTYAVQSTIGIDGEGVRCVRFAQDGADRIAIFYGEGYWMLNLSLGYRDYWYRHIGEIRSGVLSTSGKAVDIRSHSRPEAVADNLHFTSSCSRGSCEAPTTITVSGDWSELWTLTNGVHEDFYSTMQPSLDCGPLFRDYEIATLGGRWHLPHVRCHSDELPGLWYGEGGWFFDNYGHRYRHVIDMNNVEGQVAADICDSSHGYYFCEISTAPDFHAAKADEWNNPLYTLYSAVFTKIDSQGHFVKPWIAQPWNELWVLFPGE